MVSHLDYRYRLVKAIQSLETMAADVPVMLVNERERLKAKAEGVKLALSYYDEAVSQAERVHQDRT